MTPAENQTLFDAAIELIEDGKSIIPLGGKDGKIPLILWEEYQSRIATYEEVEGWFKHWPNANIAIITGKLSNLVVIDADNQKAIDWINKNTPSTGVYVKTQRGVHGVHHYCSYPGEEKISNYTNILKNLKIPIDIRAEGGYVVVPPSRGYHWIFTSGLNGFDDLPIFDLNWFKQQPKQVTGNIGIDLSTVKSPVCLGPAPKGERNNALTRLVGKWRQQELAYAEIKILADGWNRTNENPLPEKEVDTIIQSVTKTHAKNHPDESNICLSFDEVDELPKAVLNPGGLLSDIMDYIDKSSAISNPVFNLAGAISLIGTLIGQKFCTETGMRTNMYLIALGHSGSGKDSPQKAIQDILIKSNAHNILGPDELTSDAALLKHLSKDEKARCLLFMDEIGRALKALKRPNSAAYSLPTLLMKLFSKVYGSYTKTLVLEDVFLKWHHLSLYGASTPGRFWDAFSSEDSTDGFLARILIHDSLAAPKKPKKKINKSIPEVLIEKVNALYDVPDVFTGGNLCTIPRPKTIKFSKNGEKLYDEFIDRTLKLQTEAQKDSEALAAIYARANEHCGKVALIHAASIQGAELREIKEESVKWAIGYVGSIQELMRVKVAEVIADTDFHKQMIAVKKCIRSKIKPGCPGATKRQICRTLHQPVRAIDEILGAMKESGDVVQMKQMGRELFCLVRR